MDNSSNSYYRVVKKDNPRKSREHSCGSKRSGGFSNFEPDLFDAALRPARSDERRDIRSLVVLVIASALALAIGSLQVSISFSLVDKTAVLICIWTGSLQARFRVQILALVVIGLQANKRNHGHSQGPSSSGPAGKSRAGNAGGNRGGRNRGTNNGIGGRRPGGGGHTQGNGDEGDNGGDEIGNVGEGSYPRPEERAVIFLPIITGSIAYMVSLNDAELSATGRLIRHLSMIINLFAFLCCAVVLWQPYTNPRVARLMNPRVATTLSRIGSALAVLGFLSTIAIDLPTYLSWINGLVFIALLAIFLVDMLGLA